MGGKNSDQGGERIPTSTVLHKTFTTQLSGSHNIVSYNQFCFNKTDLISK